MQDTLYVIGPEASNTVKIGVSEALTRRLRQIQMMSPVPLAILWSTPGSYDLEGYLHDRFAEYRSHGEWFTFPSWMSAVDSVRNTVSALQFADGEGSGSSFWPGAPSCDEKNRRYWLNRLLRERFYPGPSFTFADAADAVGVPLAFVERYGTELAESGSLVDQGITRNGRRTYVAAWDEGDRYYLLGPQRTERMSAL